MTIFPDKQATRFAIPQKMRSRRAVLSVALAGVAILGAAGYFFTKRSLKPFGDSPAANILIIGADKPEHGRSRSDTIILARVQTEPERRITLLSLPRDTRVQIPGIKGSHRLNSAFAFGGADLLRKTVESNFGVKPQYAVTLHSEGLADVVDALGGVEVNVPKEMRYNDDWAKLNIALSEGVQKLNGEQAVSFVRFRSDGKGDLGRIQRQQTFLRAIAKQTLQPSRMTQWDTVIPAIRKAVQTDLSDTQLLALAYQFRGFPDSQLQTLRLPGHAETIGGASYFLSDIDQVAPLLQNGKASLPKIDSYAVFGAGWVALNGSGRNGYARRAARQMQAQGNSICRIANAPKGSYPHTQIRIADSVDAREQAEKTQRILGVSAEVTTDARLPKGTYVVILGDDYQPASGY